jgi:hypothetical protein
MLGQMLSHAGSNAESWGFETVVMLGQPLVMLGQLLSHAGSNAESCWVKC